MINFITNKQDFYKIPCDFYFLNVDSSGKFISSQGLELLIQYPELKIPKIRKISFRHTHIITTNLLNQPPSLLDEISLKLKKYVLYCTQSSIKNKFEEAKKEECYEKIADLLFDWADTFPKEKRVVNIDCIEKGLTKDTLLSIFESVKNTWNINLFNIKEERCLKKLLK